MHWSVTKVAASATDRCSPSSNVNDTVEDPSWWRGGQLIGAAEKFGLQHVLKGHGFSHAARTLCFCHSSWAEAHEESAFPIFSAAFYRRRPSISMVTNVLFLGRVVYGTALQLQRTLLEMRKSARIENTLLLLEHPPVITLGRNSHLANVLAPPEFLARQGVELFDIDRGGDVTFHGPGQLIAYPIFDLRSFEPKVGAVEYVRRLEEVLIRTCGDFGIGTQRIKGLTGVWTYALPDKPEAKIAAIGVHISRSVTTHGFALNVSTDLDSFSLIVPCGITGKPVTSMERELQRTLPMVEVATAASRNFGRVFNSQMLWLASLDDLLAQAAVTAPRSAANQDTPARSPKELRE